MYEGLKLYGINIVCYINIMWRGTVRAAIDRHRKHSVIDSTRDPSMERFLIIQIVHMHYTPIVAG